MFYSTGCGSYFQQKRKVLTRQPQQWIVCNFCSCHMLRDMAKGGRLNKLYHQLSCRQNSILVIAVIYSEWWFFQYCTVEVLWEHSSPWGYYNNSLSFLINCVLQEVRKRFNKIYLVGNTQFLLLSRHILNGIFSSTVQ